jgi:hypothetical protein
MEQGNINIGQDRGGIQCVRVPGARDATKVLVGPGRQRLGSRRVILENIHQASFHRVPTAGRKSLGTLGCRAYSRQLFNSVSAA